MRRTRCGGAESARRERHSKNITGVNRGYAHRSRRSVGIAIERTGRVKTGETTRPANILVAAQALSLIKELLGCIATAAGDQPRGVDLPTAEGFSGQSRFVLKQWHVPNEVRRVGMPAVITGKTTLSTASVKWIGGAECFAKRENLAGVIQCLAVGVRKAVSQLLGKSTVRAHLQRIVSRGCSVRA